MLQMTYNNANTKTDAPDAIMGNTFVCCNDDERYNTRGHETGDDGGVCRDSNKHATSLSHSLGTIGTLYGLGSAHSILTT